jgi:hypothetical protein
MYAKSTAGDRMYQIKINEQYKGEKLEDVTQGLQQIFEEVLEEAWGHLIGNDLGCVIIHHSSSPALD